MVLFFILVSIACIVILITHVKLHPFFALLLVSIAFGLAVGMPFAQILTSIQDGFGGTLGKIGLIIVLGIVIGSFLENTGGALVLAEKVLAIIGKKNVIAAMGIIGYIISIPVFADSGFILLSALNKSLTKKAGLSLAGTAIALAMGLTVTHNLVPPTPGPIAAAGILGADLGKVILLGMPIAAVSLVFGLIFAKKVASKVVIDAEVALVDEELTNTLTAYSPGVFKSLLPIMLPILLIVLKSLSGFLDDQGWQLEAKNILSFLGEPVIALIIGFFLCLPLPRKLEKKMISTEGWIGKSLRDSASIILITGAGGIFGKMLQNSGVADLLTNTLVLTNFGILLPFILAAAFKSAQGSSTVALITTASIMTSLMIPLGLTGEMDKAMVVTAIGAGSMVVSHANDSFFWVVTQMTGMNVGTGYKLISVGTFITGTSAIITLFILFSILH